MVPARAGLPTKAETNGQQGVQGLLLFLVLFIATTTSLGTIHFNNLTSTPLSHRHIHSYNHLFLHLALTQTMVSLIPDLALRTWAAQPILI